MNGRSSRSACGRSRVRRSFGLTLAAVMAATLAPFAQAQESDDEQEALEAFLRERRELREQRYAQRRPSYHEMMGRIEVMQFQATRFGNALEADLERRTAALREWRARQIEKIQQAADDCDPARYDVLRGRYERSLERDLEKAEQGLDRIESRRPDLRAFAEKVGRSRDRLWSQIEELQAMNRVAAPQGEIDALLDAYYPLNADHHEAVDALQRNAWEENAQERWVSNVSRIGARIPARPKADPQGRCDLTSDEQDAIDRLVAEACQDVSWEKTYGLHAQTVRLYGTWRSAGAAVRWPYEYFQIVMRERRDGETWTFGQANGFYKHAVYTAFVEVLACPMVVVDHAKEFEAEEVKHAKRQLCTLRETLAGVLPERSARQQPQWRKALLGLEEVDPCVDQ